MAKTFKVKIDTKKLAKKIDIAKKVLGKTIRKELKEQVLAEIKGGRSPVRGFGRFDKYSESYRLSIKNKLGFFFKNGKVIPISAIGNKELKSLRASRKARSQNNKNKSFIKSLNSHLEGKKVSPVNLKLSGALLDSIFTRVNNNRVTIGFKDEKFEYHNEGQGNLPIRRMLPTNTGEQFNRSITLRIRNLVLSKIKKIFK